MRNSHFIFSRKIAKTNRNGLRFASRCEITKRKKKRNGRTLLHILVTIPGHDHSKFLYVLSSYSHGPDHYNSDGETDPYCHGHGCTGAGLGVEVGQDDEVNPLLSWSWPHGGLVLVFRWAMTVKLIPYCHGHGHLRAGLGVEVGHDGVGLRTRLTPALEIVPPAPIRRLSHETEKEYTPKKNCRKSTSCGASLKCFITSWI
jgi:hypothetical protein